MNNANVKEKEPLKTAVQLSNFFPNEQKKMVDAATSQQQEQLHVTSELKLATCSTSLVPTVQPFTGGEPPSPNIVQQTITRTNTQPTCTATDTEHSTTQPGTADFQLSAEPSSSRHCAECNTISEEIELHPTDIGEIYYASKSSHDFCVALKSLSTAERYALLKHHKQPSSSYIYPVTLIGIQVQASIQALVVESLPVDCFQYQV